MGRTRTACDQPAHIRDTVRPRKSPQGLAHAAKTLVPCSRSVGQLPVVTGRGNLSEIPPPPPTFTGYTTHGLDSQVTAPAATAVQPLQLSFQVYVGQLPLGVYASDITVFRDGIAVADCTGPTGTATPDP